MLGSGLHFPIKELVEPSEVIKTCVDKRSPKLAIRYNWLFSYDLWQGISLTWSALFKLLSYVKFWLLTWICWPWCQLMLDDLNHNGSFSGSHYLCFGHQIFAGMLVFFHMRISYSVTLWMSLERGGHWRLLWQHMKHLRKNWVVLICTSTAQ